MAWLGFIIFVLCHTAPWFVGRGHPVGISPIKIIALASGIANVPYFLLLAINPNYSPLYGRWISASGFETALFEFSMLYCTALLVTFAGIKTLYNKKSYDRWVEKRENATPSNFHYAGYFLYAIALLLIAFKFYLVGGISAFLANIANRAAMLSGTGWIDVLLFPSIFLGVSILLYSRAKIGRPSWLLIAALVVVAAVLLSFFGGRKMPLLLILISLILTSHYVKTFRWYSLPAVFSYIMMILIFTFVLSFRLAAQGANTDLALPVIDLTQNLSYLDTYLFLDSYFSGGSVKFWHMKTFSETFLRFVPGYYGGRVPPLDDGVYVRTLYEGMTAEPGMPYEMLYMSSLPPETYGWGRVNFGIPGIMVFALARGLVVGYFYHKAARAGMGPISLFVATFVALTFQPTNLRIFQTATLLAGTALLAFMGKTVQKLRAP